MAFSSLKNEKFCFLKSTEETLNLGAEIAQKINIPAILFLYGDLGSGKTTFAKGFIHEKTLEPIESIPSPTFVYMNEYGNFPSQVAHFDLYRLESEEKFTALGFDETLSFPVTALIEWPEKIEHLYPSAIRLKFSVDNEGRKVELIGGTLD